MDDKFVAFDDAEENEYEDDGELDEMIDELDEM